MGIELKITADSVADLNEQMASLLNGAPIIVDLKSGPQGEVVDIPSRKPRGTTKPKASAEENAATSETSTEPTAPSTESTTEATSSTSEAEPTVTYADVQKAVTTLAAARGRDAVIDVLSMFGVDHGTKLKPEQWADALAELEKAKEPA